MPPQVSLRRSRIGSWVPVCGMPALLVLSLILAVTKATPPGIGIIAFFWLIVQFIWVSGPSTTSRRRLPRVDRQRMLITGRSWTGHRTLDLAQLSRVRRVKWTFSGEYGSSIHVDYVTLTDRTGVRLSMPRRTALEPVQLALAHQREQGLPLAQVSWFAAAGFGQASSEVWVRIARTLVIIGVAGGCTFGVMFLIVKVIPMLAGYHGG